jgi:arginase
MDIDLLLVPWDSGHRGARLGAGPEALLRAGLPDRLTLLGHRVRVAEVEPGGAAWRAEVGTAFDLAAALAGAVRAARAAGRTPLVLSGNCGPAALGACAGLGPGTRVVWLDAHGDFNTPAITISGYLGGMALAMLTGRTPGLFGDALGPRPVADTKVVLADARDLDPAERDALTASDVRRVPADPAALTAALGGLGRTPVYLHLDVDVIDSAQLPGLRFPSGPGPSLTQIGECLTAVCATADVAAACIACAWLPERVSDQATREAITRLARALGTDLAWHEPVGR